MQKNEAFGKIIERLMDRENLTQEESRNAFTCILKDETTAMQQGAFLAALRAKGETEQEVAGSWQAIYNLDTTKITADGSIRMVENSGTGMDGFKTFNISTASAIVAASAGVPMARHGSRAITSMCGTVDMAEALGVDVECSANLVARSIAEANIGLFNGMSPNIHPKALGRILSQIHFGSTLNIAASLANPAMPRYGVRGVYSKTMILPVIRVMKAIGYRRALVFFGEVEGTDRGMDEASVCGRTWCAELNEQGDIHEFTLEPSQLGFTSHNHEELHPEKNIQEESRRFVALIQGREKGGSPRRKAIELNTAMILKVAGKVDSIKTGMEQAGLSIDRKDAWRTLQEWVISQNREPENGLARLRQLQN